MKGNGLLIGRLSAEFGVVIGESYGELVFPEPVCSSRIRMIPARWVPASTASNEPLAQAVAVDRMRYPETLPSLGPPADPCRYPNQAVRSTGYKFYGRGVGVSLAR